MCTLSLRDANGIWYTLFAPVRKQTEIKYKQWLTINYISNDCEFIFPFIEPSSTLDICFVTRTWFLRNIKMDLLSHPRLLSQIPFLTSSSYLNNAFFLVIFLSKFFGYNFHNYFLKITNERKTNYLFCFTPSFSIVFTKNHHKMWLLF